MDNETLDLFCLKPGDIWENATTSGINLQNLRAGQILQIGKEIQLKIVWEREPCSRLEELESGLKELLIGKRGTLTQVIKGGTVSINDSVNIIIWFIFSYHNDVLFM